MRRVAFVVLFCAGRAAANDEVTVHGKQREAARLRESAEAVQVVELARAKRRTTDLGEVLARTPGVSLRRSGALGSYAQLTLNGLTQDQIRFFLDGVPLDIAGYPFGIADVPVNLVERVEIYRGVVPLRFGADALGGAVNLVSRDRWDSGVSAAYQTGSFGTQRTSLSVRGYDEERGYVFDGRVFFDGALNNYDVDVDLADDRGRIRGVEVRRFHDRYLAYGGSVEAGVVDRGWARRLTLRGFFATFDKELQHAVTMTVPFGELTYGQSVLGATARYEQPVASGVVLDAVASYARRTFEIRDVAEWTYDWRGRRMQRRRDPGELDGFVRDQTHWQDHVFGRVMLGVSASKTQSVRAGLTGAFTTREGEERLRGPAPGRDPASARRRLFTLTSGVEHETRAFDQVVENIAFVKDYVMIASSEEVLPGNVFSSLAASHHRFGAGDALRVKIARGLLAKASCEYATRLPRPEELFGDAVLTAPNLRLSPEVSLNANAGARFDGELGRIGRVNLEASGFLRDSDRLILLLTADRVARYDNVLRARALGVDASAGWSSPGRLFAIDGAATVQSVRNRSTDGPFEDVYGDRLPNRPYLFGNVEARVQAPRVLGKLDRLDLFYGLRYVHGFFRSWESRGLAGLKQEIPSQLLHNCGATYTLDESVARVATTFEVQNLTDEDAFDVFGVQRPGRAAYLKLVVER